MSKSGQTKMQKTEQLYNAAIQRLKNEKPLNKKLAEAVKNGKFKMTLRNVALEAGVSHTPLSKGYYPQVRAKIHDITQKRGEKKDRLRDLHLANLKANDEMRKMATHIAMLTALVDELRRDLRITRSKENVVPISFGKSSTQSSKKS